MKQGSVLLGNDEKYSEETYWFVSSSGTTKRFILDSPVLVPR